MEVQKAWLVMSFSIDTVLSSLAKVTDFIGITSGASDVIATDREKLAAKIVEIDQRLFDTSKEQRAKAKLAEEGVAEAKRVEIAATEAQIAAADARQATIDQENSAMLKLLDTLTRVGNARRAAAAAFVGPLPDTRDNSGSFRSSSIPGFNTGGQIPGYGGGDSVPIMAEPGEHVIRKESVKKIGRNAAQAFNHGDIAGLIKSLPVQYFKEGGEVQGQGAAANVNLIMGEKSFPVTAEVSVAEEFISEIKTINTVRGRKKNIY